MNRHKIKAFTILEVTITMLVTAILIGITYASYGIVVKSYSAFSQKNNDMEVLLNLDHLLRRDFAQAELISKVTDGVMIKSDQKIVQYSFEPDYILRRAARVDTFKVQASETITSFEKSAVAEIGETDEQNRLDELNFTLIFQTEKIPYHYHKLYSSADLIQRNANAIN